MPFGRRMADAVLEGVRSVSPEDAAGYDVLLLGCPAMGAEVLEEDEFEPFFTELEKHLADKKIAIFGSYGWGDGEWMRNWEERVRDAGGVLVRGEGLMLNETPDEDGLEACRALGKAALQA